MALRVNRPSVSSIPDHAFDAVEGLNAKFPDLWREGWVASIVDAQSNDEWQLKLADEHGIVRCEALAIGQQNAESACRLALELRSKWSN